MNYLNRENQTCNDNNSNLNEDLTKCDYLTISSDWDLDAAFLYSSYPYLSLNILVSNEDLYKIDEDQSKQSDQSLNEDWDVISNIDLKAMSPQQKKHKISKRSPIRVDNNPNLVNLDNSGRSLVALWSNTTDKAVSVFQKMMQPFSRSNSHTSNQFNPNLHDSLEKPNKSNIKISFDLYKMDKLRQPIGDSEFRNFIDSDGRIIILSDLKQRIFDGGCEQSRRKELWPILLDIFPSSQQPMSANQRNEFIKQKSSEYVHLKSTLWFNMNKGLLKKKSNSLPDTEVNILANKIQKDVWRTDRCHRFYSGDTNKNVESLFNILMTYSLANGGFYAQGMSDLLAPLLYVLRDEALSYICFTSLMRRCASNFDINSDAICTKIELISSMISKYDPQFWLYLRQQGADQLLFVYRWLLIDCKREFPFNDSLRMFEVMWSSIESNSLSTNDHFNSSENFFSNFYSRSSSNASSLNLRLFKNYLNRQNVLTSNILNGDSSASSNYVDDELISDVEYNNTSESCSLASQKPTISTPQKLPANTSTNNFICEYCLAEKSMLDLNLKKSNEITNCLNHSNASDSDISTSSDSSLDEDCIEQLAKKRNRTKWKQNSRLNKYNLSRKNTRPRYLSLNFFNEDSTKDLKNNDSKTKLNHRKENYLNDIKNKIDFSKKSPFSNILIRSLSASCLDCLKSTTNIRKKASVSNKNLFDITHKKLIKRKGIIEAIPIIKTKTLLQPVSSPAKFSTSETGTLKCTQLASAMSSTNHLSSHEVRETISNSETDDAQPIQFKYKNKKKFKKSSNSKLNENLLNNRSDIIKSDKCTCSNNSFIDSHDNYSINKKNMTKSNKIEENKNLTTASSSGIGVSSSASSSDSSKCSTPYPQATKMLTINTSSSIHTTSTKNISKTNSFDDEEEEELIYSISKQDNPFLLFICFAIFIEHRDHIMNTNMDANDMACYFDKMTRKHNLKNILSRARYLYTKIYLSKTNVFNYLQQLNEIPLNSP